MYNLTDKNFKYITDRAYEYAKIKFTDQKRSLIIARLSKRIRFLNLGSFSEYIDYLENKDIIGEEFLTMIDSLTTNFSNFFREVHHFEFMTTHVLSDYKNKELKIWSAASSTGQEIYSILITLLEFEKKNNCNIIYKLFASDISRKVLTSASNGTFNSKEIENIGDDLKKEYFLRGSGESKEQVKVKNNYIKKIKFLRINLDDSKYNLPLMDIIFLRNVIIYFDKQTKIDLIERLYHSLKPGGLLFLGHSESLSGISTKFEIVGRSIYKRIE
ncbi:MAG: hypothetical protein OCD02_00705 [Spirochaetaceae bacterium]